MKHTTMLILALVAFLAILATPHVIQAASDISGGKPTPEMLSALTPGEAQTMIDHAARQTDRWLFLATGGIFGGCLIFAVVYQTKYVRSLVLDLRQISHDQSEVIKANSTVLTRVCDRLDRDSRQSHS